MAHYDDNDVDGDYVDGDYDDDDDDELPEFFLGRFGSLTI